MESIRELYRIGKGPSSSHTMGPKKAAERFLLMQPGASFYRITLYGSLAATGKGHLTGVAIEEALAHKKIELVWEPTIFLPKHPNALKFECFNSQNKLIQAWTAYSIGGGAIIDDVTEKESQSIYPLTNMKEILDWCEKNGKQLWEYVEMHEGKEIWEFLGQIWNQMTLSIKNGLTREGTLPGELNLPRKAPSYFARSGNFALPQKRRSQLFAYALAVSEENAGGGTIVTAPTCGASGALPAALYHQQKLYKIPDQTIHKALATAGLIGNLVKFNASISGAEAGCQAEIGTACAMASGAVTQLLGGSPFQIEYAAEMGIEHHLGLTCDPLYGLVQVPCIERNAFAAARALNHASFAILSDGRHVISFDQVVKTLKQTGADLPNLYKETSLGGLAVFGTDSTK
ncbi:MAG: L-serine ammonia-lyase, iron-sulfur-dependent, subunit alpha [Salinivirgaceae bacterium]|nr:L-serine ammonia-lyase, iron-sulfur-dependent, subunit alpha [Salinivirgaceae bacterium]